MIVELYLTRKYIEILISLTEDNSKYQVVIFFFTKYQIVKMTIRQHFR